MIDYQDTSVRLTLNDIEHLTQDMQKQLYDAMRHDICLFAWICFPHIIKDIPDFHKDIYAIWDKVSKRELDYAGIVVYRGAAKSTLKNINIIHSVCYKLEPMILFLSDAEDQAMRDIESVENEIESNEIIMALYGDLKGNGIWNRSEAEFSNGCYAVSKGWKSRSRGIKFRNQRPTLIILDDFEGEDNSDTPNKREKVAEWIEATVIPAGDITARIIFMGTLVHRESYLSLLKEHPIMINNPRGVYYEKTISEFVDEKGIRKFDFEGGHPSWPLRHTQSWIQKQRLLYFGGRKPRPWLYYQEYFNIPGVQGKPKFDMNLITKIKGKLHIFKSFTWLEIEDKKIPVYVFTGVDPAHSSKTTSNYTGILTMAIDPDENVYILNIVNEQMEIITQTDRVFEQCVAYGSKQCTIETYGYQKALEVWVRKKLLDSNKHFIIQEYRESKGKSAKWLEGLCPIINSGKVFYLETCPNVDTMIQQGYNYTGGVRDHNDLLDAFFLALHNTFSPPRMNITKVIARLRSNTNKKKKKRSWLNI